VVIRLHLDFSEKAAIGEKASSTENRGGTASTPDLHPDLTITGTCFPKQNHLLNLNSDSAGETDVASHAPHETSTIEGMPSSITTGICTRCSM
jgi:hypothetical protein